MEYAALYERADDLAIDSSLVRWLDVWDAGIRDGEGDAPEIALDESDPRNVREALRAGLAARRRSGWTVDRFKRATVNAVGFDQDHHANRVWRHLDLQRSTPD